VTLSSEGRKTNAKTISGCSGVRSMLAAAKAKNPDIKSVCIGGINTSNTQRVLYQTGGVDGIAVVSAIIAAPDPCEAAKELVRLIHSPPPFARTKQPEDEITTASIQDKIPGIVKKLADSTPLCHNMTNMVVQNFAANVAICIGASPIMSNNGLEAADLANLGGSLVVNMGTVTPDGLSNYVMAISAYNAVGGPIVFDPVGAGATRQRRDAVKQLLAGSYFDLIKGNEGEIKTVAGTSGDAQQRGVDSAPSTSTLEEKVDIVRSLAKRERNVVLMTGKVDILSDGARTVVIENGHEYLGNITGSGCTLGTTIASFLAVYKEDKLLAALAGILVFEIAAEKAAVRDDVRGPGTFVPAFLDELYAIKSNALNGDTKWLHAAKIRSL
jgi:thiamine-phosphate diphosphorylase/hydroxyethylthiazole kinase